MPQETLNQSENIFRFLFEHAPEGIVIADNETKELLFANPAISRMLGYSNDELLRMSIYDFHPHEVSDHVTSKIDSWTEEGETTTTFVPALTKKGSLIYTDISTTAIQIDDRQCNACFYTDVTAIKDTQEILKRAKEEAESANRSKSAFLANMGHELKTPLNHIIGFTKLVVDKSAGELTETQEKYLDHALTGSRHLLDLINDILELSDVESGEKGLNPTEVDLRLLLENSLVMIKEKAMKQGVMLSTDLESIPDSVTADERKLKQIVFCLMSNAVKFTPYGGEVHLKAESTDAPFWPTGSNRKALIEKKQGAGTQEQKDTRKYIRISVSDNGIGLKPEDLEEIFDSFKQVEQSENRRFQGTGLGLTLAKRLVELHGGRIWVESDGPGKGSVFQFVIPV